MKLKISDDEFLTLLQLVYAGNWVVNGCRLPNEVIGKYKDFNGKLIEIFNEKQKKQKQKIKESDTPDNTNDLLFSQLETYFSFYSGKVFNDQLATKLAELNFGSNPTLERTLAEDAYREGLQKHGFAFIDSIKKDK